MNSKNFILFTNNSEYTWRHVRMLIKQLITLANKLDDLGYTKLANDIDLFLKIAQFAGANEINKNDLAHAVQFYNDTNINEITVDDLKLDNMVAMLPEEFLPELDISEKGWLRSYPTSDWAKLLNDKHKRNFAHIVSMYNARKVNPAIQINGNFADGMARAIFFNAIGEKMPVAQFSSSIENSPVI